MLRATFSERFTLFEKSCKGGGCGGMKRHTSSAPSRLRSQGTQGYRSSNHPEAPLQCRVGVQPGEVAPRYCLFAEFSFRPILPLHRCENPIWIRGGFWLFGHLGAESPSHHYGVHHTRREALGQDHALASSAGQYLPGRLLGAVEDRIGHDARLVDRREPLGLDAQLGASLGEERRVDGRRNDVGDADAVPPLLQELDTQRLQEAFYAVLGGAVGAL